MTTPTTARTAASGRLTGMERDEMETTLDLSALADDGDTIDIGGGRTLRLRIEPDPDMSILDEQGEGVWCGRIEWSHTTNNYGWNRRPDGFTGRAEIIDRDRNDCLWWEVPADIERGTPGYYSLRSSIRDLLEYGYSQVGLQLLEECDHGDAHVIGDAWIGGVGSFYPELVPDLLAEIDA